MFHSAFIHGHAHMPAMSQELVEDGKRQFWGSVQPAVFDGPRSWSLEVKEVMERCLIRLAPVMKKVAESSPGLEEFDQ